MRFLCDFRAISARYQLTLYEKIACDVKPKLTIYVLSFRLSSAISVRFPCDFSKVSTHTVREDRMRCKAKAQDLCALTIRSDCRARFMCSHYTCEILGFTVANSRETNKQPQLQKQAQYFFMIYYHQYYLLSIIYYQ